jgi:hypothetical protein
MSPSGRWSRYRPNPQLAELRFNELPTWSLCIKLDMSGLECLKWCSAPESEQQLQLISIIIYELETSPLLECEKKNGSPTGSPHLPRPLRFSLQRRSAVGFAIVVLGCACGKFTGLRAVDSNLGTLTNIKIAGKGSQIDANRCNYNINIHIYI